MGENVVSTLSPSFSIGSLSFLQITRTTIKAWISLFSSIRPSTAELPALERLKNLFYFVSTLVGSFLIGSSYLQIERTTIISRTSLNFGLVTQRTAELPALERLKNLCIISLAL